MKLTKRTSIIVFVFTISLLSITLFFKSSITGNAVLSTEVLNYPMFDYLVVILSGTIIVSVISIFMLGGMEQMVKEGLKRFKVDKPNVPSINLEKYIEHHLSQGKSELEIKNALIQAGWDENLVNYTFERIK